MLNLERTVDNLLIVSCNWIALDESILLMALRELENLILFYIEWFPSGTLST